MTTQFRHCLQVTLLLQLLCGGAWADTLQVAVLPVQNAPTAQEWRSDHPEFGGFSGVDVMPDGELFAVTDRGYLLHTMLPMGSSPVTFTPLPMEENATPSPACKGSTYLSGVVGCFPRDLGASARHDSEGLDCQEITHDITDCMVSFERKHRIAQYRITDQGITLLRTFQPKEFAALPYNEGNEAIAWRADGTLIAIAEEPGAGGVMLSGDGTFITHFAYPYEGKFKPTDMKEGLGGTLYVLERSGRWTGNFAARIRKFGMGCFAPDSENVNPLPAGEGRVRENSPPDDALTPALSHRERELASCGQTVATLPEPVDNMEGLAVLTNMEGETSFHLLSDDNFRLWQRTLWLNARPSP
jgi:hypothetical protein